MGPRIRENHKVLEEAYHQILLAIEEQRAVTPAAEWLVDNFHILSAQIKDIVDHLPPEYYQELPKIAEGPFAGLPRVFGIAWAFVAHTDSRFESDLLKIFVAAYQKVQPLTIGELWAIPITLRLVLVENFRRIADRIVSSQKTRRDADLIADSLLGVGETPSRSVEEVVEILQSTSIQQSFAVQLLQRLRFQETKVGALLQFIDDKLAATGEVIETWVTKEHNSQSAANITSRNIITSARLISALDWSEFFEEVSLVDQILRQGSNFGSMDFPTRDRYRHRIEDLARHSKLTEIEIAKAVSSNPGHYLLGDGKFEFEKSIQYRAELRTKILRWYVKNGIFVYLLLIAVLTACIAILSAPTQIYFILILIAIVASDIAINLINRSTVALLGPKYLPRLNFDHGLPESLKTFIVVPTMFTDETKIREQLEQIEIHYLSNKDENIYLALLTDFSDSNSEFSENDDELIETAKRELRSLNERHPVAKDQHPRFSIYHRYRKWNPQEGKWMGWERKRGKLHEFNQLLLGSKTTSYGPCFDSELRVPTGIRYVITLDADTKMPRGSAYKLVGTMAHPLNRPHFDEKTGRVTAGYGILQPRITPSLANSHENSLFRKLSASRSGIDPYTSAVSDVYQDLFKEGSFTGKGIYDVAIFERVMKDRVPENSILSHDLFEGNLARCGFLSDVEFFEDFPSHTGVSALRSHRWIRGDWLLLPWVVGPRGRDISLIGHWKMIDNLRRSLNAPAIFILFFIAASVPSDLSAPLYLLMAFNLLAPAFITLVADLWPRRSSTPFFHKVFFAFAEFRLGLIHSFVLLVLLPQSAWISLDAIVRTFYRLFISRKKMLEWTTAAQAKASANLDLISFVRSMRGPVFLVTIGIVPIFIFNPTFMYVTTPILLLWLASPVLAYYLSQPPKERVSQPISPYDLILLRSTGRRIWRFFTTFVTPEDNNLPPDNFQEDPSPVIAHRSSPTNFGLYLLSIFAARDFGWIGNLEAVERLELTLQSLLRLPRHRGHFYNWYDTVDSRPLEPRYISSVDNGNLTGHLFVVAQGCEEILKSPIEAFSIHRGIRDSELLLVQEFKRFAANHTERDESFEKVKSAHAALVVRLHAPDHLIEDRSQHWDTLRLQSELLVKQATAFSGDPVRSDRKEILAWSCALQADIESLSRDFLSLAKWTEFRNATVNIDLTPESQSWFEALRKNLSQQIPIEKLAIHCAKIQNDILQFKKSEKLAKRSVPDFFGPLLESLEQSIQESQFLVGKIQEVKRISRQLISEMDFKLLYDSNRKLFSIGMRVSENQLDPSYYDLLASEARLTSFIAIAKGDVPATHWFHLGRSLVRVGRETALVSWSGSMFEYLMPSIVMHSPEGSLLDDTCRRIILRQIQYGKEKNIPWGMSESAYNKRDLHLTYQYSNFGVPDLGLKRGLGADMVVAPYATILASVYETAFAAQNLRQLQSLGALGSYGFYEAVDFTPSRLPSGSKKAIIKAYMAHHQGMALVALANVFKNSSMQRRFHSDPLVQATQLLLQERTPRVIGTISKPELTVQIDRVKEPVEHVSRRYHKVNRAIPTTQLLSNGAYTVMLTSAGAGFSRVRDVAVTRWREDVTRDQYGYFFYIKDIEQRHVWSAGYQPICVESQSYEVSFAEDRARITRVDFEITTELEVFVSPEENTEVRRLTLTNNSSTTRELEITSYSEVVLNIQAADVAHPAFSNLFIETEFNPKLSTLIASRRPRSNKDKRLWIMHTLRTDRHSNGTIQYETSRSQFIGRGRSAKNPIAIFKNERLSGTVGPVLDPILSLRTRVRLDPGESTQLIFSTGIAESREDIEVMSEKFSDTTIFDRASDLAWTQAQVKLYHLGIEPDEAHLFQRLTTRLIYLDSSLRAPSETLNKNTKDVTGLWAHGISGDHPIILVRIDDLEDRNLVRQLLKAQIYFASKAFIADLVILNERGSSYSQELQTTLENMAIAAHVPSGLAYTAGKVFVIRGDFISEADHVLLASEARAILSARNGSLSDQVKRTRMQFLPAAKLETLRVNTPTSVSVSGLEFFNGYGGFSTDTDEYVIVLKPGESTPAPWINVIANPEFGFQVSESGAGYTWAANSRENQITPWSNDPIIDPPGEAFYISDLDSSAVWSPTAAPIRLEGAVYQAHHGQGYSRFELTAFGIFSELNQFVLVDQPVKVSRLTLENRSKSARRLSITSFVEWVLGFSRATMASTLCTELDQKTKAIFAHNPRNAEHGTKIAFSAVIQNQTGFTCDRTEFIGRNSSLSEPSGLLLDKPLSGSSGGAFDPCAAIQTQIEIKPGEKVEVAYILGQTPDRDTARELITHLRTLNLDQEFERVKTQWQDLLGKVQVQTPDRSFDLVINKWYLYQTIVCRLWARAAFYQAGGAFGFRDQLQDVMAVTLTSPQMAREQILRAASRQFLEGDVQHWWHPPLGRGVRTHFSDDLLWLPYVVSHYLRVTGDTSILDETVSFIEGPPLPAEQEDSYYIPMVSQQKASLFEHCARALDASLKTGQHGLPLMGSGDWNDGMNHVGMDGKGESVWLAWFLITNLKNFSTLANSRGDLEHQKTWLNHADLLIRSTEQNAWDGSWYRRAYFGDGTPLGTSNSDECQIDSLTQTWAILSEAGQPERAKMAMQSVYERLVKSDDEMILLFTKPFDQTTLDPGYIKGYVPGVRENGGQYTHAASWVVIATALLGDGQRAHDLFSFLNPIHHTKNIARANRYRIEPYVLAGDVYSEGPNTGRGGWSWYTGAAGWMYRAGVEYIIGFQVCENVVTIKPCVPPNWKEFKIQYRHGKSTYTFNIKINTPLITEAKKITLADDGKTHEINLVFD
ncbi:MAG: glucoamylase family protein [Bdellovibrionales bacterium]